MCSESFLTNHLTKRVMRLRLRAIKYYGLLTYKECPGQAKFTKYPLFVDSVTSYSPLKPYLVFILFLDDDADYDPHLHRHVEKPTK